MPGLLDEPYLAARLRDKYKGDQLYQSILAPAEHGDFARETTAANPLMAAPNAVLPWLYYLAKQPGIRPVAEYAGLVNADATPPDLDQVWGAYRGIGQGLFGR